MNSFTDYLRYSSRLPRLARLFPSATETYPFHDLSALSPRPLSAIVLTHSQKTSPRVVSEQY